MLIAVLGDGGANENVLANAVRILLLAAGLVVALFLFLNIIAVRALGTLTLERNRELTVILAVGIGLGATYAAHAVGVSPALGAFVAGMFLGSSPFATQVRADIASLRVVLLTLFFGAAGMQADPVWMYQNLLTVVALAALLIIGKASIIYAILRPLGQSPTVALATGVCLAQVGEFAFVLGAVATSGDVIDDEIYRLIISVTIVTLIAAPLLLPLAPNIARRVLTIVTRRIPSDTIATESSAPVYDVIVIGFGPAGQIAAGVFASQPSRVLVIDLNTAGLKKAKRLGYHTELGDATQQDVLDHANIATAKAIIITVPHHRSALRMLEQVRRLAPHAHLVVRSRYQIHSAKFVHAGAHKVIGDEEQIGQSLGQHLRHWLSDHTDDELPSTP